MRETTRKLAYDRGQQPPGYFSKLRKWNEGVHGINWAIWNVSPFDVCTEQGLPYRTSETTIYENKFIITFINFAFLGLQRKLFARLNRLQNRLKWPDVLMIGYVRVSLDVYVDKISSNFISFSRKDEGGLCHIRVSSTRLRRCDLLTTARRTSMLEKYAGSKYITDV